MPGMVMPGDAKSQDTKSMPEMDMPAEPKSTTNASPSGKAGSQSLQHTMLGVSGNCDLCKARIETAAKSITGVTSAEWIAETKKLHVQFDGAKTNLDAIQKAIAKVGHDTEKYKAPDEVYNALPGCCKYRLSN
jgi:copper chaperone CopZ